MSRRSLIRHLLAGLALFGLAILLVRSWQTTRLIEDALFLAGLLLAMKALFQLIEWTGFFDLFSYGYTRILASFKSADKGAPNKRESFFEYKQNKEVNMCWEPAIAAALFLALSLLARISLT